MKSAKRSFSFSKENTAARSPFLAFCFKIAYFSTDVVNKVKIKKNSLLLERVLSI